MFSDKLSPKTRITLNARVGVELQDSTFPANSADPNLSSTLGNPNYTWFQNLNGMNQGTSATSPNAVAWIYEDSVATRPTSLKISTDARRTPSMDAASI